MPYVNHEGTRIHYQVEGEGPPLVLLHGFTGNLKLWYLCRYVDALKTNYRLILVDARGHGESDKPHERAAYELPVRVGDVLAVLNALNLDRAHIWGYSMGGWTGFGIAKYAAHRLHSLVIGGVHPYEQKMPAYTRLDGSDPEAFLAGVCRRLGLDVAALPTAAREQMLRNDFRALAAVQQDRPSLEDTLPAMNMPCCLYAGDQDPLYSKVLECAQHLPHATLFVLPGLDHSAAFRKARLVLPQVTKFLQSTPTGTRNDESA
jgi:pimeloyl-ACP methyl ester carboxylesterase